MRNDGIASFCHFFLGDRLAAAIELGRELPMRYFCYKKNAAAQIKTTAFLKYSIFNLHFSIVGDSKNIQ